MRYLGSALKRASPQVAISLQADQRGIGDKILKFPSPCMPVPQTGCDAIHSVTFGVGLASEEQTTN